MDKQTSETGVDEPFELDLEADTSRLDDAFAEAVAAVEHETRPTAADGDPDPTVAERARAEMQAAAAAAQRAAKLEAENAELREQLKRSLADFDNYRKRMDREKDALRRFAAAEVLGDFLAIADNLERAHAAAGSVEDLKQGVLMIVRLWDEALRRHGVAKIMAVGQPFDPAQHEAVARSEDPDVQVPTVTDELQPGYVYHDRLLRPAMVKVAMPKVAAPAPAAQAPATEETADRVESTTAE